MKNNLVDELFDKSKTYKMGMFCTYSLNIEFLENYIMNLNGVSGCNNLCIFTDRKTYNDMFDLSGGSRPKWINRRYLLTPIDTKGIFHPKLYLLASDKEVRFGIGSANLTREGIATNLEIASVFEVSKKDKSYLFLLKECLEFIQSLVDYSESPSAIQSVADFIEYTSDLLIGNSEENLHLFHNLQDSLFNQIEKVLDNKIVKTIKVVSPFYDKELSVHKILKEKYPKAKFDIYIQQGKSNFPIENNVTDEARLFVYKDQERYIHGKAIIFETNDGWYILTGSSNYTRSAMLTSNSEANIETSIWGQIDKETAEYILKPNSIVPIRLTDFSSLAVVESEKIKNDENIIDDWLIEASLNGSKLHLALHEKQDIIPRYVILSSKEDMRFDFDKNLIVKTLNKSDMKYAQLEGIRNDGTKVYSGKVWIVDLQQDRCSYNKKRYYVSDPSQLPDIIRDIIKNGGREELIEYLLRFNIPLDLVGLSLRGRTFRVIESQGNVFGQLIIQMPRAIHYPNMHKAVKQFLTTNYNKLCVHKDNIQLTKLDNFMLIFGTIFSMIYTFNSIVTSNHKNSVIKAKDWFRIRGYYDTFLNFIEKTLILLWYTDESHTSFADQVTVEIREDKQKMLGSIQSFQEYIVQQGYDLQLLHYYQASKHVIKCINTYITKGKILTNTKEKTLVKPKLAKNGVRDTCILRRKQIYRYVSKLEEELKE